MRIDLYYRLKPYIPWSLRVALRRWRAARLLERSRNQWPILESAGRPPSDWRGWPDGKRFAVVLTHDVEREKGLNRCRELSRLEEDLGFRSAFYFVPEGPYRLGADLREELVSRGFEVGVHDLRHDGLLHRSKEAFREGALSINRYVKEWGARGFRSGFMRHNLEWFKHLDVHYDASTFDTDPFEPQPDGMQTIFPFVVPVPNLRGGYVELPYTLVQDFNLFIILRQKTIAIWKQKLDWIASKGGMALLITHPDYMNFGANKSARDEYNASLYRELLQYVRTAYAGQYWQALPHQVASWTEGQSRPSASEATPRSRSRTDSRCVETE